MASAAFDRLVDAHRGEVLCICTAILRDRHLGADAAQDAFVRLWRRASDRGAPAPLAPWLRRAAVSAALDLLRRRRVRVELDAPAPLEGTAAAERGDAAADVELRAALERGLAALSEGQRTVFLLRHEGDLSLADVAETLGVAPSTAKTQFARACARLQPFLRPHLPETDR